MTSKLAVLNQSASACSSNGVSMNLTPDTYALSGRQYKGKAAVVTLGCAKNQVDSEVMLGVLKNNGYEIVSDLKFADLAVVNTCGFLESAIQESLDCILDLAEYKKSGRLRKLMVAGCLVERYKGDIKAELPEVDAFISVDDILKVAEMAEGPIQSILVEGARPYFIYDDSMPRFLASLRHTAYVKVSEGCNRPCTFCIIPKIRGAMRSRPIESVTREVLALGQQGVKEINLVAQDLTSYGLDTGAGNLASLLRSLDQTKAVDWIRLLYAYPIGIDSELLSTVVNCERVCNYLDLPLQHSSNSLLKEMKRPLGRYSPRKIIEFIRSEQPSIALRTTFIVGFPGETEDDIADLESFVAEGHFSSVGVFTYSAEPGTPAHDLSNQVDQKEKDLRRERVMKAQQKVNADRLDSMVGSSLRVLVEGEHEETNMLLVGRTEFQAPEVDGVVLINDFADGRAPIVGTLGQVEITEVAGYDLIGTFKPSNAGDCSKNLESVPAVAN